MKILKHFGSEEPKICPHCGQGVYDHAEMERLRVLVKEAAELIRHVREVGPMFGYLRCPECEYESGEHSPGCKLASILRRLDTEDARK